MISIFHTKADKDSVWSYHLKGIKKKIGGEDINNQLDGSSFS